MTHIRTINPYREAQGDARMLREARRGSSGRYCCLCKQFRPMTGGKFPGRGPGWKATSGAVEKFHCAQCVRAKEDATPN